MRSCPTWVQSVYVGQCKDHATENEWQRSSGHEIFDFFHTGPVKNGHLHHVPNIAMELGLTPDKCPELWKISCLQNFASSSFKVCIGHLVKFWGIHYLSEIRFDADRYWLVQPRIVVWTSLPWSNWILNFLLEPGRLLTAYASKTRELTLPCSIEPHSIFESFKMRSF